MPLNGALRYSSHDAFAFGLQAYPRSHFFSGEHMQSTVSVQRTAYKAPFDDAGTSDDSEVRLNVWRLLAGLYPNRKVWERRGLQRFPYPHLIALDPAPVVGVEPAQPRIVVVGKDLSERGLSFYHPAPIAPRILIARLDDRGVKASFVLDLSWCRFTRLGWYESGGRFVRIWSDG